MNTHHVSEKQRINVTKQASQIRFCLTQAREYREASQAVSLSTKPVLLYYSIMSLALAQILMNGDGRSSLDQARGEHAHHGLVFSAGMAPKNSQDLESTANLLIARPMISDGRRRGTFELWCQQSQEDPLAGNHVKTDGPLQRSGFEIIMASPDKHFCRLDTQGISLLNCSESLPMLRTNIYHRNRTLRAAISRTSSLVGQQLRLIMHPHFPQEDLDAVMDRFEFDANLVNRINIQQGESGFILSIDDSGENLEHMYFPPACTWTGDEIRFLPATHRLNEFAYIYIGLYILGNYARYFPDRWMHDVEQGSPLSLLSEQFMSLADARMSLLTLSELSGVLYVR